MSPRRFIYSRSPWEKMAGHCRAVVDGRWVLVSGTVGYDARAARLPKGAKAQAEVALDIIGRALREAGATFFDVVRVRVYVANRADVPTVSAVIKKRLAPVQPANTTVCAPLAVAEARVEIEVTALKRQRRARGAARRAR